MKSHNLGSGTLVIKLENIYWAITGTSLHRKACAIKIIDKCQFCREMLNSPIGGGPSFLEAQHIIPAILDICFGTGYIIIGSETLRNDLWEVTR